MSIIEQITIHSNFITKKLSALRRSFGRFILAQGLIRVFTLLIPVAFLVLLVEGFSFLNGNIRGHILLFFVAFSVIFFLYPFVLFFMILRNKIRSFGDIRLAKLIRESYEDIKDSLLNALQLRDMVLNKESGFSGALVAHSMSRVAKKIEYHSFRKVIPEQKLKKGARLLFCMVLFVCFLFFIFPAFFTAAANRMIHPGMDFPVPEPFSISSGSGTFGVLGGDSAKIMFRCDGEFPHEINLTLIYPDYMQEEEVTVDSLGKATYILASVKRDIVYEGFVKNRSPFVPWRRISSGLDTIHVTDRPKILNVLATLRFPDYTGLEEQVQRSNITEFSVLPGTEIALSIRSDKRLSRAYLQFSEAKAHPLIVSGDKAYVSFKVTHDAQFKIFIEDEKGVSNVDPVKYRVLLSPDAYPMITLLSPIGDLDLSESMEIPLGVRISDDFGFSKLVIHYKILKKYTQDDYKENETSFPQMDSRLVLQELYYQWDVGEFGLAPEDVVEFRVDIYDNDAINGPKMASSRTIRARFPSLTDLYAGMDKQQEEIYNDSEAILDQLEAAKEILEKVSLELLKESSIKWEQKTQLEQEIKKTREAADKLAEIGDRLEDMIQNGRDNQLFSEETLTKFVKLQEMFQDILTPELKEAMLKLQKALENMTPDEVRSALKKFRTSQDQFSRELDRMLELFQRIKIEQSVDELVKRFEELAERQEHFNKELQSTSSDDLNKMSDLSKEERAIQNDTEIARDLMELTSDDMSGFPIMPSYELSELISQMDQMDLVKDLKRVQQSLRKGNKSKAEMPSQRSQENLFSMLDAMKNFRDQFRRMSMDEVVGDFRQILRKILQISQSQESLSNRVGNIPRQSEQLNKAAVDQQRIHHNLAYMIENLIALSNKTFAITPRIGKGFGNASSKMKMAIRRMEDRNPRSASQEGQKATETLNNIAIDLMSAMKNLQQSGSASGFENYLQQLQQMAGQQRGLNDETMILGVGAGGKRAALQRLAARQQQVKKSLEQLQEEIRGSTKQTGDLGGIAKDMEEVIKDLKNNKILRRTMERQQRILSRLIDAQKSLRSQDLKRERKSRTAEEVVRFSPGELPKDLGERRSLLRQNFEQAMRDGYTKDYEELIRLYFEALAKEKVE